MLKKSILLLIIFANIYFKAQSLQDLNNNQSGTSILKEILDEVKADTLKIDANIEMEFKELSKLLKRAEELLVHTREVKKSLLMGTDVLNKVSSYLATPAAQFNPHIAKAKAAVKAAKMEHDRVIKAVEATKAVIEKSEDQIEKQVDRLNQSLKRLNEKSKSAIERSQPVLQTLQSYKSYSIPALNDDTRQFGS